MGAGALFDSPICELAQIPGRGRRFELVAQPQPCMRHTDLGDDIQAPSACQHEVELGERLDTATDAAARTAHALGDGTHLAVLRRQQRDDAVGLAEVEVGQHDGTGLVATRTWHVGERIRAATTPRRRCPPSADAGRCANDEYHVPVLTSVDLDRLIADTESAILDVIADAEDERTRELYRMVRYHLGLDGQAPRGKRLRPLIGLLAYQSIAGEHVRALPGAAAVELGHNFSLVHDDIEDHGLERRHRPALWTLAGMPQAINTGDTLFTLSRMALYRLRDEGFDDARVLRLMRLYDETCLALCEGQFMDIWASEHDEWMSVDSYFDMIGRKTAALIAGSAEAGAVLATDDENVIAAYRRFGWALGLAFQLNDDLLGIWGDTAVTGKETSDIVERKKTLPLIYARQEATGEDAERLRAILVPGDHEVGPTQVAEVLAILERVRARDYTRRRAQAYRDEAMAEVAAMHLAEGDALERLTQLAGSAISA